MHLAVGLWRMLEHKQVCEERIQRIFTRSATWISSIQSITTPDFTQKSSQPVLQLQSSQYYNYKVVLPSVCSLDRRSRYHSPSLWNGSSILSVLLPFARWTYPCWSQKAAETSQCLQKMNIRVKQKVPNIEKTTSASSSNNQLIWNKLIHPGTSICEQDY